MGATIDTRDPLEWVRIEFQERRARNPHYSLRAFARALRIAPGPLSELLAGKRVLSKRQAARIAERLALAPEERERFLATLDGKPRRARAPAVAFTTLESDVFSLIADWHHYAILSLMETRGFREDPAWIARRLGIPARAARGSLRLLEKLQLVRRVHGKLVAGSGFTSTDGIPDAALRRAHQQELVLATQALEVVPLDERYFSSATMAIDPRLMPVARRMITRFRRQLMRVLETGERREVYNLNLQFFPLTKKETDDEKHPTGRIHLRRPRGTC